jgi:transposase-like protein
MASRPNHKVDAPDPEVSERAFRRSFTAEYKLAILEEADACKPGSKEIGALLRRVGLYSSLLSKWRHQRAEGILNGLRRQRGPKPCNPLARENERLKREMERLSQRLKQAELIIDIQKKVSEALGIATDGEESIESN